MSAKVADMLRGRGAILAALPAAPGLFELRASSTVDVDVQRTGTRLMNRCPACQRYQDVVGTTPLCLRRPHPVPLPDRVLETDLGFGSGDSRRR